MLIEKFSPISRNGLTSLLAVSQEKERVLMCAYILYKDLGAPGKTRYDAVTQNKLLFLNPIELTHRVPFSQHVEFKIQCYCHKGSALTKLYQLYENS